MNAEPREVEVSARTAEEAARQALVELGLQPGEAAVTVLEEGGRGWLGLSVRSARVRVRALSKAEAAQHFVRRLAVLLESQIEVAAAEDGDADDRVVRVSVQSDDSGRWIGRGGHTLAAIECLCDAVTTRISHDRRRLILDVNGYRAERERSLEGLARWHAQHVLQSGKPVTLEPMSPSDRRIVHLTVQGIAGVRSESTGEGAQRRVVLTPDQ